MCSLRHKLLKKQGSSVVFQEKPLEWMQGLVALCFPRMSVCRSHLCLCKGACNTSLFSLPNQQAPRSQPNSQTTNQTTKPTREIFRSHPKPLCNHAFPFGKSLALVAMHVRQHVLASSHKHLLPYEGRQGWPHKFSEDWY